MKQQLYLLATLVLAILLIAAVSTTLNDFFMPGSQPGQSGNLETPDKCDNCHGGYDLAVEPAFNWRGSMMAQSMRDPLFLACLAIANQDAPESGDLCIRCHAPDGWLNGRSVPTDGSALNNNDRQGVQCDFCHKLVKPSYIGVNPFPADADYTSGTYSSDQSYLGTLTMIPPQSGNGMYIAHSANAKRGPFVDAAARHQMHYSPFHSESDICGTCHDVSNPVFTHTGEPVIGQDMNSKSYDTYKMLPVERTYSEWKMSTYASAGVSGTPFGGNKATVSTCQDCHMRDVSGYGANKKGIPYRNDLPLHDMTGGNTFIPDLVAQLFPGEVNIDALQAGKQRALFMLQNAATMNLDVHKNSDGTFNAAVSVINETGHKLPSGYPEGRRIWVNLQAYNSQGNLVYESGAYNQETAELQMEGAKIYEIKLGMTPEVAQAAGITGLPPSGESFHFVLNNKVVKDNRIPPRGFTNSNFEKIQSPVVAYTYADGQYNDLTGYTLPADAYHIRARLLYQTVSKEYADFLKSENRTNNAGNVFYTLYEANGKSAPVIMREVNVYTGTPPVLYAKVSDVHFTRYSAKGGKQYVTALVTVTDDKENPVAGAAVTASFSGPLSRTETGITNMSGTIEFTSGQSKDTSTPWCLDVTNIVKEGYTFAAGEPWCESLVKSAETESVLTKKALQVYPNPFTEEVQFIIVSPADTEARLEIFDMTGRKITTLFDSHVKANVSYQARFRPSSGNRFLYRLHMGNEEQSGIIVKN
jgi:hypothetical protein